MVEPICNEDGIRFEGANVAEHEEDASRMIIEISDEEIKSAMFDIDSSKVVGPYG
ncbi:hypothetical protein Tco_0476515, partial [Tanacetum coccineum]